MKNRISIRGIAVATGVVMASSVVGAAAAGAELPIGGTSVTTIGPLPSDASITRTAKPAGELRQEIKAKHRRQAARADRQARAAADQHASRSARSYGGDPRGIGAGLAASQYGWGAGEFSCLDSLWTRESDWDVHATNPSSGAYGIPQALPGSKMSAYGGDWRDNPTTQIEWGLAYIDQTYGTPCGAWSTFQSQGWY